MQTLAQLMGGIWRGLTNGDKQRHISPTQRRFDRVHAALAACAYHGLVYDIDLGELCLQIDYSFGEPSLAELADARQALARDISRFLEELKFGKFYSGPGMTAQESVVYGQGNGPRAHLMTQPSGALRVVFSGMRADVMRFFLPRYARRFALRSGTGYRQCA
jgi:hypothetical protein